MPWSKTASVCEDMDDPQVPQPNKNFPKPINLLTLNNVGRTAAKVNRTNTRLDLFIASWITTHLMCNNCRSTGVLTSTSNNQVLSMKSGTLCSADITLRMFDIIRLLDKIHRSFKRDSFFLTMRLISLSTILERKEYMPNMNNMPKHHGVGLAEARGPMQLHRLHLLGRSCCGFVNSPLKFITVFDRYQSHTFRIFTAVLYLVTFCSNLSRFDSIYWLVKYCHLSAFSFFTAMFFVAHCHPFPT